MYAGLYVPRESIHAVSVPMCSFRIDHVSSTSFSRERVNRSTFQVEPSYFPGKSFPGKQCEIYFELCSKTHVMCRSIHEKRICMVSASMDALWNVRTHAVHIVITCYMQHCIRSYDILVQHVALYMYTSTIYAANTKIDGLAHTTADLFFIWSLTSKQRAESRKWEDLTSTAYT